MEQALDSNELLIKYKRGFAAGTVITAEYIIVYPYGDTVLHFFIDQDVKNGKYIGNSFFNRTDKKFISGQQTFKVLKKYKKNVPEQTIQVLMDRDIKPTERNL